MIRKVLLELCSVVHNSAPPSPPGPAPIINNKYVIKAPDMFDVFTAHPQLTAMPSSVKKII